MRFASTSAVLPNLIVGLVIAVLEQAPVEEGTEHSLPVIEALGLDAAEQEKQHTRMLLIDRQSEQDRLDNQLLKHLQVKQAGPSCFAQHALQGATASQADSATKAQQQASSGQMQLGACFPMCRSIAVWSSMKIARDWG